MIDNREIKRQIRLLRKLKKDMHKGTQDRRDINKKIRELKTKMEATHTKTTAEKQSLIDQVLVIRPEYKELGIDLYKYTEEQLLKHIVNIKIKGRLI